MRAIAGRRPGLGDNARMLHSISRRVVAATVTAFLFVVCDARAQGAASQQAPSPSVKPPGNPLIEAAQAQADAGDHAAALALYEKALASDPRLNGAHIGAGRALDFLGRHAEARKRYQQAIDTSGPDNRAAAFSATAVSYAFESNAAEAAKAYQKVFDERIAAGNPGAAAGTANAIGRVYLESGDRENAEKWYRTGYETSKQITGVTAAEQDLWLLRWLHAQGRIAARRGNIDAARRHASAMNDILARGQNEDERPQYQYLLGYIALEAGEYDRAIAELQKGNLDDSFVLGLIGRAYEKKGDAANAKAYYAKVLASSAHNINTAFSRQWARNYLKQ
jgi:tetratricopeptide (TPR) repeat protein